LAAAGLLQPDVHSRIAAGAVRHGGSISVMEETSLDCGRGPGGLDVRDQGNLRHQCARLDGRGPAAGLGETRPDRSRRASAGMAVPFLLWKKRLWIVAGVLVGLMFATKETFAISVLAWTGAGLLLAWEKRALIDRAALLRAWREHAPWVAASGLTAMAVAAFF